MENTTPLLPQQLNHHNPDDQHNNIPTIRSLEEFIELSLENFGCIQLIQTLLVSLMLVFDSQQTFISVFTDAEPSWHCTNTTACNTSSNICDLPTSAWSWDGSSHQTIISEWELECETSFITGLPSSSFFLGCLVGNFIFAALGDSNLGRKNLLFLCSFAMSITAATIAFANNIWVYSVLRFVSGCFRASILTSTLVLLTEKVGKKRRGLVSIVAFICFSLGMLTLPAIAYLNRDSSWRYIYVWTSVPAILYCVIVYFLVSESPRCLFVHGRQLEALKVLKRLSTLTHESLQDHSDYCSSNLLKIIPERVGLYSSIKTLLNRRWATRRLIMMMGVGIGVGLAYYGLLLGVDNLNFDSYLSVTFNGLMDLPAYLLSYFLIEKWSRKGSILTFCVLSGLFSIICAVTSSDQVLQLVSELVSLFSVCVTLNVLLIYATELFPTTVRNLTTSMVRQAVFLGALISPVVDSGGIQNVMKWCYAIYGGAVLCCGFFVICLPETKGVALCDTFDEQEMNS